MDNLIRIKSIASVHGVESTVNRFSNFSRFLNFHKFVRETSTLFLSSAIYFIKYSVLNYSLNRKMFKDIIYFLIEKQKLLFLKIKMLFWYFQNHLVFFIKVTRYTGPFSVVKVYITKHIFFSHIFYLRTGRQYSYPTESG